jgi:hypothetical protein
VGNLLYWENVGSAQPAHIYPDFGVTRYPGEPGGVSGIRLCRPPASPAGRPRPAAPRPCPEGPPAVSLRSPARVYGRPGVWCGPAPAVTVPGSSIRGRPPDGHRAAAPVVQTRPWPSSRPGAGSPAGRANMTFASVNGTSLAGGAAAKHRRWPALYRRVCIAFGNLTRQAGGRRVPAVSDITEMRPIRNALETYPGHRDNIAIMPLTWDDAPLPGSSEPEAKPGKLCWTVRC